MSFFQITQQSNILLASSDSVKIAKSSENITGIVPTAIDSQNLNVLGPAPSGQKENLESESMEL